jgi:uncharacterized membrane protein
MEPKRTRYDTNPLDGKVAERSDTSFEPRPTSEVTSGPTRPVPRFETEQRQESEAPTRRIEENKVTSYPSVFIPPQTIKQAQPPPSTYQPPRRNDPNIYQPPPGTPPSIYQPPPMPVYQRPMSHTVAGLGIPEKWANILPYIPGHLGAVAAVVELFLVPRTEGRTRFHAAQGLALQIAILALTGVFSFVSLISGNGFGSGIFGAIATIFLIVSMVRVFKGKPHIISPLDDPRKWLDDKIKPRK